MRIQWSFNFYNLSLLQRRMLVPWFIAWNWPNDSGEEDFQISSYFHLRHIYYIPLEKSSNLHLNKLESPLPKDVLCLFWLKMALWIRGRRFKNVVNLYLCALFHYLFLQNGGDLYLNQLKGTFVKSLIQFWPMILKKITF